MLRSLPVSTIKSRPLRFVSVEFKDEPGLSAAVAKEGVSALLAVPGLSRPGLTLLGQVAEAKQLYSLALDSEMVERALALGVANNGGRPQIVINEKAARASGLKFETSVLKLARVVQ